jgi:NADPH2:quinone reductase
MLAVVMTEHGGPEVLRLMRTRVPEPRTPHDALVRVHAAGVSPSDSQARRRPLASHAREQLGGGLILGMEGAGVVEAVGRAATRFGVGNLRVVVERSYPLADAPEVHRALEAGEIIGRVVLEIP